MNVKKRYFLGITSIVVLLLLLASLAYTVYNHRQEEQAASTLGAASLEDGTAPYQEVIENYPGTITAKRASQALGMEHLKKKEYKQALTYFKQAEKLPEPIIEAERWFGMSQCYYELGVYDQANQAIDQALAIKGARELVFARFKLQVCDQMKVGASAQEKEQLRQEQLNLARKMYYTYKQHDDPVIQQHVDYMKKRLEELKQVDAA